MRANTQKRNALKLRCLAVLTAAMTALLMLPSSGFAQTYPSKPVKLVLPFAAGTATDIFGRKLAFGLSERLGQQIVVDNRAGAGGSLAAEIVARAPADGYTIFLGTIGNMAVNVSLFSKLAYDPVKDFEHISLLAITPLILAVPSNSPMKSFQDVLDTARAKPGLTFGSSGVGSSVHMAGALLSLQAKIELTHLPYKSAAQAVTDLITGELPMMFYLNAALAQPIKEGKIRALAVTSLKRFPALPDVKTIDELGLKGYEATVWFGLSAPAGTPRPIIDALNKATHAAMTSKDMTEFMAQDGSVLSLSTPEEYKAYIVREIPRWAEVVKASGAKAD